MFQGKKCSPKTKSEFVACTEAKSGLVLPGRRWWAESRHGFLALTLAPILSFILTSAIFKWWVSINGDENPASPSDSQISTHQAASCLVRFKKRIKNCRCANFLSVIIVSCFSVYPLVILRSKSSSLLKGPIPKSLLIGFESVSLDANFEALIKHCFNVSKQPECEEIRRNNAEERLAETKWKSTATETCRLQMEIFGYQYYY